MNRATKVTKKCQNLHRDLEVFYQNNIPENFDSIKDFSKPLFDIYWFKKNTMHQSSYLLSTCTMIGIMLLLMPGVTIVIAKVQNDLTYMESFYFYYFIISFSSVFSLATFLILDQKKIEKHISTLMTREVPETWLDALHLPNRTTPFQLTRLKGYLRSNRLTIEDAINYSIKELKVNN